MLSRHVRSQIAALTCCLALAGCDGGSVLEPDDGLRDGARPVAAAATLEEVCATIDFEALAHGDAVSAIAVPELDLAFDVTVWPSNGGLPVARAYDTDTAAPSGDPFLAWSGEGAACAACEGRGRVLVVEDGAGFAAGGASDFGGTFFLDGFSQAGVWIRSVTAVNAAEYEGSHLLYVDAEPMAVSTASGEAVQAMTPVAETPISDFVELVILAAARGGFDDLVMCRMMETTDDDGGSLPPGGEGCGAGFWKNPRHFAAWEGTGLEPGDGLVAALGGAPAALRKPEQGVDPASLTLADALGLRGPGVNQLVRQAAAALLNASSDGVSYDLRADDVLAAYAAALAGGDVAATAETFAGYNEQVCPLD
jgi:hypothetical protein